MNRLTGILKRAPIVPSESPAEATGTSAKLVRTKEVRTLLPAPVGKREQAKRFIGTAFSASPTPTELEGPLRRHAKPTSSRTAAPQASPARQQSTTSLADRFNALREPPKTAQTSGRSEPGRAHLPNPMLKKGLSTIHEVEGEDDHDHD